MPIVETRSCHISAFPLSLASTTDNRHGHATSPSFYRESPPPRRARLSGASGLGGRSALDLDDDDDDDDGLGSAGGGKGGGKKGAAFNLSSDDDSDDFIDDGVLHGPSSKAMQDIRYVLLTRRVVFVLMVLP